MTDPRFPPGIHPPLAYPDDGSAARPSPPPNPLWSYYAGPHVTQSANMLGRVGRGLLDMVDPVQAYHGSVEAFGAVPGMLSEGRYGAAAGSGLMGMLGALGTVPAGPKAPKANALVEMLRGGGPTPPAPEMGALAKMLMAGESRGVDDTIRGTADRLEQYARSLGYRVERDASNASQSRYLMLEHPSLDRPIKVRVSDHPLPPSYGQRQGYADLEVGPHQEAMHWANAVGDLSARVGAKMPDDVAALIARDAAESERMAASLARWNARRLEQARAVDKLMAERGLSGLEGKARKRARQKMRAELGFREE